MTEFKSIYSEKQRKKRVKDETVKLEKIFQNLGENSYETAKRLIQDAAFMSVTLSELQLIITRDGPVEPYQNGENQRGLKKSAAVEAYDKMVNTYAKIIKQLVDMIPKKIKLITENGEETLEEIEDDSAAALLAYVKGFKR